MPVRFNWIIGKNEKVLNAFPFRNSLYNFLSHVQRNHIWPAQLIMFYFHIYCGKYSKETSLLPVKGCKCYPCSAPRTIEQWWFFNKPHLYNGNLRGPATLTTSLYNKSIYAQPCVPTCNTNFTYKLEWWFDLYIWNHYLCLKIYWQQMSHTHKPKSSLTLFERHK